MTVIEVMVAITVLLIATAAAFGSQIASFGLIDSSRDAAIATTDLEACMEMVLTTATDDIPDQFEAGVSIPEFRDLHLRDQRIVATYPTLVPNTTPDPLDIVLVATWLDARGRRQTLQLATQATR